MEFIVSSSTLFEHLQVISRVLSSKNSLPILDNYLFAITGDDLVIRAADMETTIIASMKVDNASESASIAMPAKILNDILKEFSDQPLTFKVDFETYNIDIISENGKFSVVGMDADDFPLQKEINVAEANKLIVPSSVVLSGINKTLFAVADDELRPVMNGIFVEASANYLTFVATDAHKMVRYRRHDIKSDKDSSFILHKRPAALLKGILSKKPHDIEIEYDSKYAMFTTPDYKMICCLIEGKYPNYESVIPISSPNKAVIDRVDILTALKRVSIFSNQGSALVKLKFTSDICEVSGQDIDFSISAFERLNCQFEGEEPIEIGFKAPFLIDLISALSTSDIVFELGDQGRAGLVLPFQNEIEDEEILMLLMPLVI